MKTAILSMALALAAGTAAAQTATPKHGAAPAKAPAKAAPAKKVSKAKPAAKPLDVGALAAHSPSAEAVLGAAELAIAERVHVGDLPCEMGASVKLVADTAKPGYFDLQMAKTHYRLVPVPTSTGAIRLEDAKAGAVWLQLANKSMLMNHKLGQRLADECKSPQQVAVAEEFKLRPPPSVLDGTPAGAREVQVGTTIASPSAKAR
ncbi:hypothetical protein [Pseudorhodoferax sp.]|uniref:hypothetical protein n=1 Tax=Pseudorhodoferax sp. TaxID=1993553 RepID=UPI0039E6468B